MEKISEEKLVDKVRNYISKTFLKINPIINKALDDVKIDLTSAKTLNTEINLINLIYALDKAYEAKAYLDLQSRIMLQNIKSRQNLVVITSSETAQKNKAKAELETREDMEQLIALESSADMITNKIAVILELINAIKKVLGGTNVREP